MDQTEQEICWVLPTLLAWIAGIDRVLNENFLKFRRAPKGTISESSCKHKFYNTWCSFVVTWVEHGLDYSHVSHGFQNWASPVCLFSRQPLHPISTSFMSACPAVDMAPLLRFRKFRGYIFTHPSHEDATLAKPQQLLLNLNHQHILIGKRTKTSLIIASRRDVKTTWTTHFDTSSAKAWSSSYTPAKGLKVSCISPLAFWQVACDLKRGKRWIPLE